MEGNICGEFEVMFCILVLTLREAVSRPVDEYSVNIATGIY
jgi:hypothetical protein